MSEKAATLFENYEEAKKYSLTILWKIDVCNVGENCWCRLILPTEQIFYKYKIGEEEKTEELESISGSIHKETAEHLVELHNKSIR
jgi:hypothetical protein